MNNTYREIVYFILDSIKSINGDSTITEEHVIYLAGHYRTLLLELKKLKNLKLSSSNELTICIDLEPTNSIEGINYCNQQYLMSTELIPEILDEDSLNITLAELFNIRTTFISKNRFKYVGHNKYMKNILYCTIGDDKHLYFNSMNPQFKYIKKAKITGIFEDALKAASLSCNDSDNNCDILDVAFPIESSLLPLLFELCIKDLLGVNYRPSDTINNAGDDLADIAAFVRRLMKSKFAQLMTE